MNLKKARGGAKPPKITARQQAEIDHAKWEQKMANLTLRGVKPDDDAPKMLSYTLSYRGSDKQLPSKVTPNPPPKANRRLTPEEQIREKAAREKKYVIAPAANKMGYQLITDPADYKTMGRKV